LDDILRKKMDEIVEYENQGNAVKALERYKELLIEYKNDRGPIFFEIAVCLFRFGKYAEALDNFINSHRLGCRCDEIEKILYEGYYEPNLDSFKENYSQNIELLSAYRHPLDVTFPDFEYLGYWFLPYTETRFVIFDSKQHTFISKLDLEPGNYFSGISPKGAFLFKDEYNIKKLEQAEIQSKNSSAYKIPDYPLYLVYDNKQLFFEYLQVNDYSTLLTNERFIFLFGKDQADKFFRSEEAVFPIFYFNAGKEDEYYKLVETIKKEQMKSGEMSYTNLMNIFDNYLSTQ